MDEEIYMVPVPKSRLPLVYKLLAGVETSSSEAPAESSAKPPPTPADWKWAPDDMRKLAIMMKSPAGRAIMSAIAEKRGKAVPYGDLRAAGAKAVGGKFRDAQVRAQLAWFAKYCKRLTGQSVWPITFAPIADPSPESGRWKYSMEEDLAEAWLAAVRESDV